MYKAIIIGGSAGSFQVITKILSNLPAQFPCPVLLCLHRLKHVRSGFMETLSVKSAIPVTEPFDKEHLKPGIAYLAPSNYHMLVEIGNSISLSTDEVVNHSRPSIDLSFITAARNYRQKIAGILLSGANRDGAYGISRMNEFGGTTIVQDPEECEVKTMTETAIRMTKVDYIYNTEKIIRFLQQL